MATENSNSNSKKQYRTVDSVTVGEVCELIRDCLPANKACAIVGISYETFRKYCAGDKPEHPDLAATVSHARAVAEHKLLKILDDPAITNPQTKAVMFKLGALDPVRYRDSHRDSQQGPVVQFILGAGTPQPAVAVLSQPAQQEQLTDGDSADADTESV